MKSSFIFLSYFAFSSICYPQDDNHFDLCHDQNRRFFCLTSDDYTVNFLSGLFSGFRTNDDLVRFDETNKCFIIKNESPKRTNDSLIILQLVSEGPIIKNKDTTIYFEKLTDSIEQKLEGAMIDFFNFFIYLDYSDRDLSKISFDVGTKQISLKILKYKGKYYWDISSINPNGLFILDHTFSKLESITLLDKTKKIGVSLYTNTNNNFIRFLETYKIDSLNSTIPGFTSTINYNQSGVAKTKVQQHKECNCK